MSSYKIHPRTDVNQVRVINSLDVNVVSGSLGDIEVGDIDLTIDKVEISGDVNIGNELLNVEISGGTFLTQPVEISGGIQGDVNIGNELLNVEISGETNVNLVSYNDDAFGRLRVSNPYSLFDFTSVFGKDPLRFDEDVSDGASSIHTQESYISMDVSASNGVGVVRQSREYIPYQPGKSKLYYLTGVLTNNLSANITSRIGSFDSSYGHFFEYSNGVVSVVERDNGSEIRIVRSNWIDPLDGTGRSGVTIDFTKAQIYYFDQEWLGVGRVRGGIIADGIYYQCVNFSHNGSEAITKPYYRLAKLPIRYEIRSNGDEGSMRMICGSIMSEGGYNNIGTTFASKTFVLRQLTTSHNLCPIISLRLRDISATEPHLYATVKLKFFDILNRDFSDVLGWKILWNPTLTLNSGSFVDYDALYSSASICYHTVDGASRDTFTGGVVLGSGYGNQRGNFTLNSTPDEIIKSVGIGRSISGVSDTITLAAQAITGTINLASSISWVEIR